MSKETEAEPCSAPMSKKMISIAIVGKPNAGKSTLLNYLVGHKLSIVTPKVQTTRSIVTGVVTHDDTQIVMLDTPGIFEPRNSLEKSMVRCAWSSLHSVDLVVVIIDVSVSICQRLESILSNINQAGVKVAFLFNKSDIASKANSKNQDSLQNYYNLITNKKPEAKIFEISALTGDGIEVFLNFLKNTATYSPWLYQEDDMTNLPVRFLASEFTREQLFLQLDQELPYRLTVETEAYTQTADGSIKVNQVIIVERETYKTIILGKNGSKIKSIGIASRMRIEEFLQQKIHLFLFVKVRKNWDENPHNYSYMGLKYDKF